MSVHAHTESCTKSCLESGNLERDPREIQLLVRLLLLKRTPLFFENATCLPPLNPVGEQLLLQLFFWSRSWPSGAWPIRTLEASANAHNKESCCVRKRGVAAPRGPGTCHEFFQMGL